MLIALTEQNAEGRSSKDSALNNACQAVPCTHVSLCKPPLLHLPAPVGR